MKIPNTIISDGNSCKLIFYGFIKLRSATIFSVSRSDWESLSEVELQLYKIKIVVIKNKNFIVVSFLNFEYTDLVK